MNFRETDSNAPVLLDLVNSRLVFPDEIYDEIGTDADAREWLRARGGSGSPAEIEGARRARAALVPFLRGEASDDVLTPWLAGMRKSASLEDGRLAWSLDVDDELSVGVRALEEWDALQTPTGSRIRPCANQECQHFLVDHSKANSRKWHSMDTCGNRMKSRRHYARTRELAN
jgi:predicted RNA-binding Zn ribbon-like protein